MNSEKHDIFLDDPVNIPIACTIAPDTLKASEPLKKRRNDLEKTLFQKILEKKELSDGFAFKFPNDHQMIHSLIDFIDLERECCAFFTFELIFESQKGSVWLHIRGPEGAKEFINDLL